MNRCIYCHKNDGPFRGKEHVIPQFLGTFNPENLILKEVCDGCNNKFSKLETVFKEDTVEGFIAAQYRLRQDSSIRFRNERLKFRGRVAGEQRIFDRMFPTLDPQTGNAIPTAQIVIEGRNGKIQIIYLKGIRDAKNFAKRISWTGTQGASFSVFGNGDEVARLIFELRKRGVNFRQIESQQLEIEEDGHFDCEFEGRIDLVIERFISKVAFNYFSYCAIKSGLQDILYDSKFHRIRKFVLDGEGISPVAVTNYGLAIKGQEKRANIPFHLIRISERNNTVMTELSIFGHMRYVVALGRYPFVIGNRGSFGLGHRFDLVNGTFTREDPARFCMGNSNEFQLFSNIAGIRQ